MVMLNDEYNDSNEDSNECESPNNSNRMSLRERHPRQVQQQNSDKNSDKRLRNKLDELKFLQNFNPEESNRERRKLKRKSQANLTNKNLPYSETGILKFNGFNLCDCMNEACRGCFYECESCGSTKCGPTCRCNRKYWFEMCIFDGKDSVIPNNYLNLK